jgi:hypothetical protein
VTYVTKATGDTLGLALTESRAVSGDTFEADGLVLDAEPPDTTITGAPPPVADSASATLSFTSDEPTASFLCSLDGATPAPCTSPLTFGPLPQGDHSFSVAAVDALGEIDPTPATATWTVSAQSDLLSNGSFEGTLDGWSATGGTLSLATDGIVGQDAARLAVVGAPTTMSLHTWPQHVATTYARTTYAAGGFVRSDGVEHRVCLIVRERNATGVVASGSSCLVPTATWQSFAPLAYTALADGDELEVSIFESAPAAGDSFEIDGLTLAERDPTIDAAGDIACDPASSEYNGGLGNGQDCMEGATAALMLSDPPTAVLPLGDNQYECGSLSAYQTSYAASWGRLLAITRPVPGNHEYYTGSSTDPCDSTVSGAGYYGYFGAAAGDPTRGYYSYDLGPWHLIALNAQCSHVGGCGAGSPEETWLKADLAAHPDRCVLAYWHQPRFSSGQHGDDPTYVAFWDDLYAAGADVVLNGHDHDYERFAPQTPAGVADPAAGIREFVVGTGGRNHDAFITDAPNSEARNNTTFGVLRLQLRPTGYDWQFVPTPGGTFTDSGSAECH